MFKAVFLNSERLNFDQRLDFTPLAEVCTITDYKDSNPEEILARSADQEILITKELPMGKSIIEALPASVKLICEAGTGYNNIDLAAAAQRGIKVCNVPGYSTEAVAQLAVSFMLNFASSMVLQQNMLRKGNYDNFTKHLQVPHFELQNKTLGIIGSGTIGQQVIKLARAFGMNVLIYNRTAKHFEDSHVKQVPLEDLLSNSDFISIHCPLTADTKYLINKESLSKMKPTAFIINTSRGPIIKETDLIEALQNGIIAGAALDVQDPEPPELTNPLFFMDNVILTPHIGWKCIESRQRLLSLLANNIKAFIEGCPINVVG